MSFKRPESQFKASRKSGGGVNPKVKDKELWETMPEVPIFTNLSKEYGRVPKYPEPVRFFCRMGASANYLI